MPRLLRGDSLLLLIDLQEKLMPVIDRHDDVAKNVERLIRGCHLLDAIPIVVTEQYVKGLGLTIPSIRLDYRPIEKISFSACGCAEFLAALRIMGKKQAIVAGIETHVCVYQTVTDLLANRYEVTVVADAVGSRTASNKEIALRRMITEGAKLSSTEMVLFELLGAAGTDEFRDILKLVR